jgi:beta-glucosidase
MSAPPGRTHRYYTGKPLFAFGHGLSLTDFTLQCSGFKPPSPTAAGELGCAVANVGTRDGDEVVFLYAVAGSDVRAAAKHPVPLRSLVDFTRVSVSAGQSKEVRFVISPSALGLTDENGEPRVYAGKYSFVASRGHGVERSFNMTI